MPDHKLRRSGPRRVPAPSQNLSSRPNLPQDCTSDDGRSSGARAQSSERQLGQTSASLDVAPRTHGSRAFLGGSHCHLRCNDGSRLFAVCRSRLRYTQAIGPDCIWLWGSALFAVGAKRLHDRNKSALWYPLFGLARRSATASVRCYRATSPMSSPRRDRIFGCYSLLWLWALVELGFLEAPRGRTATAPILSPSRVARRRLGAHFRPVRGD